MHFSTSIWNGRAITTLFYLSFGLHSDFYYDNTMQIHTILQYDFRHGYTVVQCPTNRIFG